MATRHNSRFSDALAQEVMLDDTDFLRGIVERTVQQILEAEMTQHIAVERYERGETRRGYRNGYKPRTLKTRVGTLELMVPQDREGNFSTAVFERYQRNEKALVLGLMEWWIVILHRAGRVDTQGRGYNGGAVRHQLLQEPGFDARRTDGPGTGGVAHRTGIPVPVGRRSLRGCAGRQPNNQPGGAYRYWRQQRRQKRYWEWMWLIPSLSPHTMNYSAP